MKRPALREDIKEALRKIARDAAELDEELSRPRPKPKRKRRFSRYPRMRLKRPTRENTETLERLLRWPSLRVKFAGRAVRIWSGEHECYWRAKAAGYTADGLEAGIFTFEDAFARVHGSGPEKRIEIRLVTALQLLAE